MGTGHDFPACLLVSKVLEGEGIPHGPEPGPVLSDEGRGCSLPATVETTSAGLFCADNMWIVQTWEAGWGQWDVARAWAFWGIMKDNSRKSAFHSVWSPQCWDNM